MKGAYLIAIQHSSAFAQLTGTDELSNSVEAFVDGELTIGDLYDDLNDLYDNLDEIQDAIEKYDFNIGENYDDDEGFEFDEYDVGKFISEQYESYKEWYDKFSETDWSQYWYDDDGASYWEDNFDFDDFPTDEWTEDYWDELINKYYANDEGPETDWYGNDGWENWDDSYLFEENYADKVPSWDKVNHMVYTDICERSMLYKF